MEEYRCLICPKFGMFSEVEMKNHGEDFHNDLRSICRVCLNRFPTDKQLGVHRTSCKAPPPPLTYRSSVVFQDLALKHTDNSWQSIRSPVESLKIRDAEAIDEYPVYTDVKCLDTHKNFVIAGGRDKETVLFDLLLGDTVDRLPHQDPVNVVKFVSKGDAVISAADKMVFLWKQKSEGLFKLNYSYSEHDSKVKDLPIHPTNRYILSVANNRWIFYDICSGIPLKQVEEDTSFRGFSCAEFDPEGILFATGDGDSIKIWDIRSQGPISSFVEDGGVNDLAFSTNRKHIVTATRNGMKLLDNRTYRPLMKLNHAPAFSVCFDHGGTCLAAAAGSDVGLYGVGGSCLKTLSISSGLTCLGFGPKYLAIGSGDEHLRIWEF